MRPCRFARSTLLVVCMGALACGGEKPRGETAQGIAGTQHQAASAEQDRLERTESLQQTGQARATVPADACGWIPRADVEAILGPLLEPPAGTEIVCRYALPVDRETAKRRAKMREAIRAKAGPELAEATLNPELDSVAVLVSVDLAGDLSIERLRQMAGDTSLPGFIQPPLGVLSGSPVSVDRVKPADRRQPPSGWDVADTPQGTADFTGRVGHVKVTVRENSADRVVPSEKKAALAARIRDGIADLPFAHPYLVSDPMPPPPGADPCSLLEPNEAEEVLGTLVVAPYRSIFGGPYAAQNGSSCAYYTAGHHVLILTPEWTNGTQRVAELRAADALLNALAKDPHAEMADTLDGPWEDVTFAAAGTLGFLSGDRFLQISYLTSSTDAAGAVALARIAIARLTASSPPR